MTDAPASDCARCVAGPQGMNGHERLQLLPMRKGQPPMPRFVLYCLDCGAHWQRLFTEGRGVHWARATMGIDQTSYGR